MKMTAGMRDEVLQILLTWGRLPTDLMATHLGLGRRKTRLLLNEMRKLKLIRYKKYRKLGEVMASWETISEWEKQQEQHQ